jgi:hypothetical protein
MESLEPPAVWEEAQEELEELAALLRSEGYETYVAGRDEPFHAHLQESAEQVAVEVLNVVFDHALDAAAVLAIERIVHRWAKRRRRFRDRDGARATAYIWGPDGEILHVVELPPPEDEQRSD